MSQHRLASTIIYLLAAVGLALSFQNISKPNRDLQPWEREPESEFPEYPMQSTQEVREQTNSLKGSRLSVAAACANPVNVDPHIDCQFPTTPVDLSTSKFFPPIGDQGVLGSCQSWTMSYNLSYYQAKAKNWDLRTGDPHLICSPGFLYFLGAGAVVLENQGCAPLSLYPYSEHSPATVPSIQAFSAALRSRQDNDQQEYGTLVDSWEAINLSRGLLASGKVLYAFISLDGNFNDSWRANPARVVNENSGVVYGGHSLALVGYDDRKPYTVNGVTKYGAFLLANSWGSLGDSNTAGTKGFIWFGYDGLVRKQLGLSFIVLDGAILQVPVIEATVTTGPGAIALRERRDPGQTPESVDKYFYHRPRMLGNPQGLIPIAVDLSSAISNDGDVSMFGFQGRTDLPMSIMFSGQASYTIQELANFEWKLHFTNLSSPTTTMPILPGQNAVFVQSIQMSLIEPEAR